MNKSPLACVLLAIMPFCVAAQDATPHMHDMHIAGKSANPATQAYMDAMQSMHGKMQAITPANDASKDFVIMMKPHHQAAVEMAEAYLKYGKDPVITKMAKNIIASQKREIAVMTAWEAKHGIAGR